MKKPNFKFLNFKNKIKKKNKNFFLLKSKWIWISNFNFEQVVNITSFRSVSTRSFDWWICLNIPATEATMQPPVGPLLSQHGFNTSSFCKGFNEISTIFPKFLPLRVIIKLFNDKSLLFKIKLPSTSYLIYSILKIENWKYLLPSDIFKLSILKKIDFPKYSLTTHSSMILGTMKSMKIFLWKN